MASTDENAAKLSTEKEKWRRRTIWGSETLCSCTAYAAFVLAPQRRRQRHLAAC